MYVLVPSNSKQLTKRALWFKNPIARKLAAEKNIQFGFELKGEPETIKKTPPLFWGYHLHDYFATEWYYHPEKRQKLLASISHIPSLQPAYVNLHGIHLWWQPPSRKYLHRYQNRSKPREYLKIIQANIELAKKLKQILPLKIENYPLYSNYQKDEEYLPETYLYTGTGRLNDLLYLKEKAGIDILLDLEHLILTLNFLNRRKNYRQIPVEKITNLTFEEQKVYQIFGFYIRKDSYPYVLKKVELNKMIEKIGAKFYHLTGSTQDVIPGKKELTHGPIKTTDKTFRKNLRLILAQKPEATLVETASSGDNPCFRHLRPNETELSFYALCEILLEEL